MTTATQQAIAARCTEIVLAGYELQPALMEIGQAGGWVSATERTKTNGWKLEIYWNKQNETRQD